jgi:hypothetical protein
MSFSLPLSQACEAIAKEGCSTWCRGTQPKAMGLMSELNTIVSFSFTELSSANPHPSCLLKEKGLRKENTYLY